MHLAILQVQADADVVFASQGAPVAQPTGERHDQAECLRFRLMFRAWVWGLLIQALGLLPKPRGIAFNAFDMSV